WEGSGSDGSRSRRHGVVAASCRVRVRGCVGCSCVFSGNATTGLYTLSLHDALPIWSPRCATRNFPNVTMLPTDWAFSVVSTGCRSEEHTSELQSQSNLVCRLLLEKNNECHAPPPTQNLYLSSFEACVVPTRPRVSSV